MIMFDKTQLIGYQSAQNIDTQISDKETLLMEEAYRTGLHPAEGIKEPGITTFARGPLAPTFIGNGTFLKCDRCEDIHDVEKYDAAFPQGPASGRLARPAPQCRSAGG